MVTKDREIMKNYIGKRKYCSQMTDIEKNGLFKRLKEVEDKGFRWRMSGHTVDRLTEKGIRANYKDLVSTIYNSEIVEYKIDANKFTGEPEERVVLVSKVVVNRCYRLKVVYSITERRIVTTWINHIRDTHKTLNWDLYTADMPVFGI